MRKKKSLGAERYIVNDLTQKKREVQRKLRVVAGERTKGKKQE